MKLLLDTHVLIWWVTDDPQLSSRSVEAIQEAESVCYSLISFWEICLKLQKKKQNLPLSNSHLPMLRNTFAEDHFKEVSIAPDHCMSAALLPPHHRDPWDRLIIATAQSKELTLVSKDRHFSKYDLPVIW